MDAVLEGHGENVLGVKLKGPGLDVILTTSADGSTFALGSFMPWLLPGGAVEAVCTQRTHPPLCVHILASSSRPGPSWAPCPLARRSFAFLLVLSTLPVADGIMWLQPCVPALLPAGTSTLGRMGRMPADSGWSAPSWAPRAACLTS